MTDNANTFQSKQSLTSSGKSYDYFSLAHVAGHGNAEISRLPVSLRILLENLLRTDDGSAYAKKNVEAILTWDPAATPNNEITFTPARVLLQDFTGVPCVVDLASMRDAMQRLGGDPARINPLQPVDLVIDHSVQVDAFGRESAAEENAALEYERNRERYIFLRWGQQAFDNFRVVPPDTGIVHQINIEHLAKVVFVREDGAQPVAYFDTLVGTDSHTPMVNGLGVVGWGVGGIEAEAAMLGQPISMLVPRVVGVKLTGALPAGTTATDLVLTITQILRKHGVVGKFVEFYGDGLDGLSVADRATISNMAPEYGATIGFFPVDRQTLGYLRLTGRSEEAIQLVEDYSRAQGIFRETGITTDPVYSEYVELDLSTIVPSIAGPRRPQDRILLTDAKQSFRKSLVEFLEVGGRTLDEKAKAEWLAGTATPPAAGAAADESVARIYRRAEVAAGDSNVATENYSLTHGDVVLAAITSCTNTSNPNVLIAAGLLARKAAARGLKSKPWVKTSLAPGSLVVTRFLENAGLMDDLEKLGFHVVGYGCTTCIGNSGPLPEPIANAITEGDLVAAAVLSGNRNFEGRVNPHVRANYLASPPLVVAYAIAGTMNLDLATEALGTDSAGQPVYLKDIWPTADEVNNMVGEFVERSLYHETYAKVFDGDEQWRSLPVPEGKNFTWEANSTYVKPAPFFDDLTETPAPRHDIKDARVLAMVADSVTTDHISPAGSIAKTSPAAAYLREHGVEPKDFNSYGARRGNHEVMVRGTFANIRLRNQLVPGTEGGVTVHIPSGEQMSIFDASVRYRAEGTPLIILAGQEYGSGSSRDWAAKGPALQGVSAVIAESYERIHRSNLVGLGILPLQYEPGANRDLLGLTGLETFQIHGIEEGLTPGKRLTVQAHKANGNTIEFHVICRIDTPNEVEYYKHGGILQYVLRQLVAKSRTA